MNKYIRVNHCIQCVESREIRHFASINKAKRHSRETFARGDLRKAEALLPTDD